MKPTSTLSASEMVSAARKGIENLSPTKAYEELIRGEATLIDVREPHEYEREKIAGAINAPRGMLEFYADPATPYYRSEFTSDTRLIICCASGGRSALAAQTLSNMGYMRTAHVDGGISAWKAANLPTVDFARFENSVQEQNN